MSETITTATTARDRTRPATRLRRLLAERGRTVLTGGAHNGLSARIVERAGFDAVWVSGFEVSASHGVPDANVLTMSDMVAAATDIARAVRIPAIADCDNGYGNAVNVVRTVEEFERAGIAGICIEDNIFPKRCSFYGGVKRELAAVEEHAGKVRAALEARADPDFVIIARTEALIAGWGMGEALLRARAYADAGADLILIHSKAPSAEEVLSFARQWDRETPLVAVPTKYPDVTVEELGAAGFRVVIFANQGLRAQVEASTRILGELREAGRISAVEDRIAPLETIYDLVGLRELKEQEKSYLPAGAGAVRAVILAAGDSPALGELTADRPKAMLDLKGRSLLERQVDLLNGCGVKDVACVRGYRAEAVAVPNVRFYDNARWAETDEVASLFCAEPEWRGRSVIVYGDVLFDRGVLERLLLAEADVVIAVDRAFADSPHGGPSDLVRFREPPPAPGTRYLSGEDATHALAAIGPDLPAREAHGEWIGVMVVSERGAARIREVWDAARARERAGERLDLGSAESAERAKLTDLLGALVDADVEVACVPIYKGWLEVDSFEDYRRAWSLV